VTYESDGTNAVVVVFNNAYDIIPRPGDAYVNTDDAETYITPDTISFKLILSQAQNTTNFTYQAPYNPFLIVNGVRSHEVHLPDYPPTSKADETLFNMDDDNTNASQGIYYKTSANLPWALHFPENWDHMIEKQQITWGYLGFRDWAESQGIDRQDWYKLSGSWGGSEFYLSQETVR